ncbi:MAG: hypothetical protein D6722_19345 [Bacteroidetes bacterium]|nr:MAG: hypothetical protein D6722_19345 [Bacteroidota bacterium]
MKYKSLIAFVLLLALAACRPDQTRFIHRMEGTWTLAHEEVVHILPSGEVVPISEGQNLGTLLLENNDDSRVFLDYTLTLPGVNFDWNQKPFKCDEARRRVFFYNFFCNEIFNCDLVATIQEDTPQRQVWMFIRPEGNGIHRRVTWTFERN